MTAGVSDGILQAVAARRISATSAMTNMPAWRDGAVALRPFEQVVDVGLHLNLTLGTPLGPMPRFAPDGRFPTLGAVMRQARSRLFPEDEIAAEIARQADRFIEEMGRPPQHIDGHQHVHVLPAMRRLLLAELVRRNWTPWLRDSGDRPWRILRRRKNLGKALTLAALSHGFVTEAKAAGCRINDGFAGFSAFRPGEDYGDAFASFLTAPGRRHLVMCHPGKIDDELRALDPVVETRPQELAYFLSDAFEDELSRCGVVLERLSKM